MHRYLFRPPLFLPPHCLRQFERGMEWVWALPPAAAKPTPTPYLGEPPQAANTVQIRARVEKRPLESLARASLATTYRLTDLSCLTWSGEACPPQAVRPSSTGFSPSLNGIGLRRRASRHSYKISSRGSSPF